MDGIDVALIETDGSETIIELCHSSIRYDPRFKLLLKAAEYSIRKHQANLDNATAFYAQDLQEFLLREIKLSKIDAAKQIDGLSQYLSVDLEAVIQHSSYLHGLAVKTLLEKFSYTPEQIDVVGYHGQTMLHQPAKGISVIVGDGRYLAEQLKMTVVNDFRSRDIAAGGQGAPFAPLYHRALAIRDKKIPVAVVNCGGIANITLINSANDMDLMAYDTGPGNGLIDRLVQQRTQCKEQMDLDGQFGSRGKVHPQILNLLYEKSLIKNHQNYLLAPIPKSLDIGDMQLIPELDALSLEDACATLEAFTAYTIVKSLELLPTLQVPQCWILAGGGWNNPVIRTELETRLHQNYGESLQVLTADEAGWNSQGMEAQIFAYLAVRSLQNKPLSLPGTTGVTKPMSGGRVHIPHSGATDKVENLIK